MSKNRNREYREAEKRDAAAREVAAYLVIEAAGRISGSFIPYYCPDIDYILGYHRRDVQEAYRFLYQLERGEAL